MEMPLLLAATLIHCKGEPLVATSSDSDAATKIREQCIELRGVFEDLENSDDKEALLQHLMKLCSMAYQFDVRALDTILKQLPITDLSLKEYLPRAVEKLGRYRAIAIDLINAARTTKHTLFRRITVRSIKPPGLPNDGALITTLRDFHAVWSRTTSRDVRNQTTRLQAETRTKYQNRIFGSHTKFKVHAEIQLLCFYEQRPNLPRPRIICASKSACYLCDLFFKSHGKFVIPRTHGRIYDRWTLPPPSNLKQDTIQRLLPVLNQFNQVLEVTILRALKGEICKYPPPIESTLAVYEPWSSASIVVPPRSAVSSPLLNTNDSPPLTAENECLPRGDDTTIGAQTETVMAVSVQSAQDSYTVWLEQGEQVCRDLDKAVCLYVQTPTIHLQFSWSSQTCAGMTDTVAVHESCRVRMEYLSAPEELTDDAQTFDVNRLRCGRDEEIHYDSALSHGQVTLRNGGHRLCLAFEKVSGNGVMGEP